MILPLFNKKVNHVELPLLVSKAHDAASKLITKPKSFLYAVGKKDVKVKYNDNLIK